MLTSHPFPGNVRELENLLEKICFHPAAENQPGHPVTAEVVKQLLVPPGSPGNENPACSSGLTRAPVLEEGFSLPLYLQSMEKQMIATALEKNGENISRTATALGLSRQGLKNKLRRYGIKAYYHSAWAIQNPSE